MYCRRKSFEKRRELPVAVSRRSIAQEDIPADSGAPLADDQRTSALATVRLLSRIDCVLHPPRERIPITLKRKHTVTDHPNDPGDINTSLSPRMRVESYLQPTCITPTCTNPQLEETAHASYTNIPLDDQEDTSNVTTACRHAGKVVSYIEPTSLSETKNAF